VSFGENPTEKTIARQGWRGRYRLAGQIATGKKT